VHTDRDRLIWLAGFLDGEGSFFASRVTLKKGNGDYLSYRPRVFGCNTHRPTMDVVVAVFENYGKTHQTTKHNVNSSGGSRAVYHANITTWEGCRDFCRDIAPFLVTKREQAEILAEWASDRLARYERFGKFRTGFNDDDHAWYNRLRVLNARGGTEYAL
jgi:hypothetical protein